MGLENFDNNRQGHRSVVVVDDNELLVEVIGELVEGLPGFVFAGGANDGMTAVETVTRCQPDFVLLDYSMPGLDGVEAARRIQLACPHTGIIGMSVDDAMAITEGFKALNVTFVRKDTIVQRLPDLLTRQT